MRDKNETRANYRRGVMPLAVLSLLKERDKYGYELVQEIGERTGGAVETQEGSLYPVLYKLEESGYISSSTIFVGRRLRRVMYHIEVSGKEHLEELIADYMTVTQAVYQLIEEGRAYDENE